MGTVIPLQPFRGVNASGGVFFSAYSVAYPLRTDKLKGIAGNESINLS